MRTPAAKRYQRRFAVTMALYVLAVFAWSWGRTSFAPDGAALIALSVMPALPVIGALVAMGLYLVEETDEFVRQRIVTAMLFGIGVVLSVSTVIGFLQYAGVVTSVDVFWGFPLWCFAWGLAQCGLALRDRVAGAGA
ncbi:hypothetical protein [Sphingomonas sp.]|uniref:hypothetical protein n=1 Tax=Sphingomonas sp. TaxID=28214 RepID=UPI001EBA961A|nr:hypothetical protein [Sphingomonas sp.]MBX3594831.1 hypothetical protein [Sphingomonas sp.]